MAVGDGVVWNEALPDDSVAANQIDEYNRDLRLGVRSRMNVEHVWTAAQTAVSEAGFHRFVTFQQQTAAPSLISASGQVGALYVGSSAAGYPLMFDNSAGTAITLVNSAGKISAISGGTQGSIVICSSANAASLVVLAASAPGLPLVTQTGTGAPKWIAVNSGGVSAIFGAWTDKIAAYAAQTATSDGIVCAVVNGATGDGEAIGYSDADADPSTVVGNAYADHGKMNSMTFPVKKGNTWKITLVSGTFASLRWLALGV